MIEVRDAFRIFQSAAGGTVALQGLNLAVEPGEIVVVLGPSGSGKTTLLRVLAGFERLSAGSARVAGVELSRLDARAVGRFRARTLGLLDQHYARSLSADITCAETVALQLGLLGEAPASALARAEELLERVGLGGRGGDRPGALSGGEQQRVAVCAAVAHRPRVLLADEPAGELDARNAARVYGLLGELVRDARGTAVIVSHDAAAAAIADRLVHVRDGRVVEEARPGGPRSLVVSHGWVRLPQQLFEQAGRPGRLDAVFEDGRFVLEPLEPAAPAAERAPVAAAVDGGTVASLRDVVKAYGDRRVLDGISREFPAGALTAVVGRSGSGKTTLLHLLAGLDRPSAGEVLVAGVELGALDRSRLAELRRSHVGLVTQEPGLVPYLSARENVELGLALRGREPEPAAAALAEVGLAERLDLPAARLSAGERQRVAIARALAAGTSLLLVDEPTARLDEESARVAGRLLARAAREHGVAVVCATHDPLLVELADEQLELVPAA
jgi:ABC-type lipoprotein export system ATPase subunit